MENRKRSGINRGGDSNKKFYKPVNRPNKEDFVFGIQSVLETLRSGKEIDKIILQKGASLIIKSKYHPQA